MQMTPINFNCEVMTEKMKWSEKTIPKERKAGEKATKSVGVESPEQTSGGYSSHAAATCMNRLSKLSARWTGDYGFSIGIDDVQSRDDWNHNTSRISSEGNEKFDNFILDFNKAILKLHPGCNAAALEAQITGGLNNIRDETGKNLELSLVLLDR